MYDTVPVMAIYGTHTNLDIWLGVLIRYNVTDNTRYSLIYYIV